MPEERQVEKLAELDPLREERPPGRLLAGVERREPGASESLRGRDCRPAARPPQPRHGDARGLNDRGQFFADFFSGVGHVARHARRLGFCSREWEVSHGAQCDLTRAAVIQEVGRMCKAKRILGAMLATPCTSFSCARDRTRVIRSREAPWGLEGPSLSSNDRASLAAGNATCWATVLLLRHLNRHRVPWILENPWSSKLWWIPEIAEEIRKGRGIEIMTDFCQWGTEWRKRTRLMGGNLPAEDVAKLARHCCGSRGYCSRGACRKHKQIRGNGPGGIPWTRIAQPYPRELARGLASSLLQGAFAEKTYNRMYSPGSKSLR